MTRTGKVISWIAGVIIEGVETAAEWAMVRQSDALAAQGYYLARPATFDGLDNLPIHFEE